jgi:hypothetical protein
MRKNRITQSIIIGLATFVSTISWTGLKNILFEGGNWLWPSIGFFVLLVFLSLSWLLAKSKEILLIALIFILASFFLVFGFKFEYLAALFIALLLFIFGSYKAISEKELRIKIQISKILRRGLPIVLTGLSLIVATVYYFSPAVFRGENQIQVPRPLFDIIIQPVTKGLEEQISLPELSERFDVPLQGEVNDMLYQVVNQEINKYSQSYKEYLPLGLAIGFFFALKAISIVFMWLVILCGEVIFRLLVRFGAIKIQEKAVLKQVIET